MLKSSFSHLEQYLFTSLKKIHRFNFPLVSLDFGEKLLNSDTLIFEHTYSIVSYTFKKTNGLFK